MEWWGESGRSWVKRNYYQNIIYEKIQLKNKNRLELEDNTYPDTLAVKYYKKKRRHKHLSVWQVLGRESL